MNSTELLLQIKSVTSLGLFQRVTIIIFNHQRYKLTNYCKQFTTPYSAKYWSESSICGFEFNNKSFNKKEEQNLGTSMSVMMLNFQVPQEVK